MPASQGKVCVHKGSARLDQYDVATQCRTLEAHQSGFYGWLKQPRSMCQREYERWMGPVKLPRLESGGVYDYHKIHHDLRELGECCGKHRVAKLMKRLGN